MSLRIWIAAMLAAAAASASQARDADIDKIAAWLTGDFENFAQVSGDESGNASYVHLKAVFHICPVRIEGLSDTETGRALYFEQALAGSEEEPYRQGVYLLVRENGVLVNRAYRISNPSEFVGGWKEPERLKSLTSDRLAAIRGCEVILTKMPGDRFNGIGGMNGTCPSKVQGATYMISHVEITPGTLIMLEQGFDDDGNHRWGPPRGTVGDVFRKRQRD